MGELRLAGRLAGVAQVDASDLEWIRRGTWWASNRGGQRFVVGRFPGDRQSRYLARVILDAPPDLHVSYRNGDRLDLRRQNLVLCLHSEATGKAMRKPGPSGFVGVSFHADAGKWRATLRHQGKFLSLGLFDSPTDAAAVRSYVARRLRGPFVSPDLPAPALPDGLSVSAEEVLARYGIR